MEIPKLIILLCCAYCSIASQHSHTIPIEGYETELQDLGQHVDIPETPVKVIKITKTVAVKVPVPYPVKVIQKVPYPVHVAKPYPVPVPQIIKVPHISPKGHSHDNEGNTYHVQEGQQNSGGYPQGLSAGSPSYEHGQSDQENYSYEGSPGSSYDAPASSYYGQTGSTNHFGGESEESKNYDQAIKGYFDKLQPGGNTGESNNYHPYHH